jgi:hypothetical protein
MPLTTKKRDNLSDKDFAVPGKRALPIHDEVHVRMAHSMLDKTKGLTPAEKKEAQSRILKKAKELGMDTSNWDIKASEDDDEGNDDEVFASGVVSFSALSMTIPDQTEDHPNKTPFNGILTRLDEPSDNPLHGSHGKCVVLPTSVAEDALSSLLGMAIDFTDDLEGHDVKKKIGLITEANIVGNAIEIAGFFYGADFPSEVKRIQAEKSQLGFSYEAQVSLRSMNDNPLVVKNCVFTGAAVLYKDCAAYTTTSLAANSEIIMNEEIKKLFEALAVRLDGIEQKIAANAEEAKKVSAGSVSHMVMPHSAAIRNCAAGMEAAGLGMHASQGHVAHLNKMADHMDADAAMGKLPHIYQTSDFYSAGKDEKKTNESSEALKEIKASMIELSSKMTDMEKQRFAAAAEPERKTVPPYIAKILAKGGINPEQEQKITAEEVSDLLKNKGVPIAARIAAKLELRQANKMA